MESCRNGIKNILICDVIVLFQHVEQGFFVTKQAVEWQMIVDQPLFQLRERNWIDGFDVT